MGSRIAGGEVGRGERDTEGGKQHSSGFLCNPNH